VNASSTQRAARRLTLTRVLGSVGVIGAAAAVAGRASVTARWSADGTATVPLDFGGVVPGGSVTKALDLVNDGDSALASVRLATVATQSSVLDTDAVNGLQMSVQSCSVAWTNDTCSGSVRTVLAAGPVVRDSVLANPASLVAKATDHLAVTLALPATAGDAFKQKNSGLALTFTATQRDGVGR
jgi:hypothetical protein